MTLAEIGARGDATVRLDGHTIYAPFVLPGEEVRARIVGERAQLIEILRASSDRREPVCAHFGACGGCQLQHWRDAPYLAWKRDQVARALARRGGRVDIDPILDAWGAGRRRAAFHAHPTPRGVGLGFVEPGGAPARRTARRSAAVSRARRPGAAARPGRDRARPRRWRGA